MTRSRHPQLGPSVSAEAPTVRGRRRREAILDAAGERFLEHGFHGTSMDDVGAAAGISGPGLYRHFASKDALLMAVLDRVWAALEPALHRADGLAAREAIDVLLEAHLDLALDQPTALVLLIRELRHLPERYRAAAARNHARYVDAWARPLLAGGGAGVRDLQEARVVAIAIHGLLDAAALSPGAMEPARRRVVLRRLVSSLR
jgi:AcrR family transcriptional regulator